MVTKTLDQEAVKLIARKRGKNGPSLLQKTAPVSLILWKIADSTDRDEIRNLWINHKNRAFAFEDYFRVAVVSDPVKFRPLKTQYEILMKAVRKKVALFAVRYYGD